MSIQTKELCVGYNKKVLLNGINVDVKPGEVVTLIGPNGSGKSTILKTITCQLEKLKGSIALLGKDMEEKTNAEIAREMSMVMTERIRPEMMSCREVVATGRYPYTGRMGILSKEDWVKVDDTMKLLHADETRDIEFGKISDGQRQRVMLARALCQEPSVLVLDEPTSYLDMRYKLEILNNIRILAKERKISVLMSLHELDLAQKISDRILCIDGKKVDRVGTPRDIFCGDYIQTLYGVSKEAFDPTTGMMHFPSNKEAAQIFVICGGGEGVFTFQELQRQNIPFAAGILATNDMEYNTAKALAQDVIAVKAFHPIDNERIDIAKKKMDACEQCVCTVSEFGPLNQANEELVRYAKEQGKYRELESIWQR